MALSNCRETLMTKRLLSIAGLLILLALTAAPVAAQSPRPEDLAAARELVTTMKLTEQMKALIPILMKNMKATMLIGRSPEFVRDFEAAMPTLMAAFDSRYGEFTDLMAGIYATNFTAPELQDMTAFYRTPTGQKVLRTLPAIAQQSVQAGQAWGLRIGEEIKQRMIDEMRKKGHAI